MSYSPVLVHHGIVGMKWYVRRYQNPDGTLTELGKRRQQSLNQKSEDKLKREAERKAEREKLEKQKREVEEINEKRKKPAQLMTDAELNYMTNRLRQEQTYNQLLASLTPKQTETANSKIKTFLVKTGQDLVTAVAKEMVSEAGNYAKNYVSSLFETDAQRNQKATASMYDKTKKEAEYYRNLAEIAKDKNTIDQQNRALQNRRNGVSDPKLNSEIKKQEASDNKKKNDN